MNFVHNSPIKCCVTSIMTLSEKHNEKIGLSGRNSLAVMKIVCFRRRQERKVIPTVRYRGAQEGNNNPHPHGYEVVAKPVS